MWEHIYNLHIVTVHALKEEEVRLWYESFFLK